MLHQILKRDKDALKYAPKVFFQDQNKKGSRSYSTSARLHQEVTQHPAGAPEDPSIASVASMIDLATEQAVERLPGLKFDLPSPLPKTENVRSRYDPVVEQFTKLLMEDGKLSRAQKVIQQHDI
jgi:hypothetical protein